MTRIDFYVLKKESAAKHDTMVCRIVEKIWQAKKRLFIVCETTERAKYLNELLWVFSDVSFIPHELATEDAKAPILIGSKIDNCPHRDVLMNMGKEVSDMSSSFDRVVESAGYDPHSRELARNRYRYYQDRGFPLKTHKISV